MRLSRGYRRPTISRFDSVVHKNAEDNLARIIGAIRDLDYPGYPAVDVLTRAWEIDEPRRMLFVRKAQALRAWADVEESTDSLDSSSKAELAPVIRHDPCRPATPLCGTPRRPPKVVALTRPRRAPAHTPHSVPL